MGRSPTSPEPHHYAARCLAASGQDEFAKREYRLAHLFGDWTSLREAFVRYPGPGELLDIVPQTPEGLLAASSILADRPDEAREAYRRLWEGFLDTRGLAGFAETTLKVGREKEALELARELRTLEPLHPQSYVVASEALTSLGDEDAARTELDLGASRLPGNAAIFGAIGLRELASKHPGLAKTWFDRIVARTGPEIARKKVLIARALAAQGRTLEALREAQDAAATDRSYAFALEALARYAAAAGQFEVAVDALERAMRMNPARAEVYGELLRLLREKHSSQELRRAGDGDTRP